MRVIKKDFPSVLQENELAYFSLIEGLIASVDTNAFLEIRHSPIHYSFRISPSFPSCLNSLVEQINALHNLLGIKVEWGKSLKNAAILSFNLLTKN